MKKIAYGIAAALADDAELPIDRARIAPDSECHTWRLQQNLKAEKHDDKWLLVETRASPYQKDNGQGSRPREIRRITADIKCPTEEDSS